MESKPPKKRGERKKKVILVFDPKARKEYLTGFRKRKQERRKRAQEQLQRMLKEDKKAIRRKTKEMYKKLLAPYENMRPQPEILLKEEHDLGSHSVEITELSPFDLAKQNNWIGNNQAKYEEDEKDTDEEAYDSEALPGMELEEKPVVKKNVKEEDKEDCKVKSMKDLKRTMRKQATQHVKKSKAFKTLGIQEKMKNKKRSKREKREKERSLKKSKRYHKLKTKMKSAKAGGESKE